MDNERLPKRLFYGDVATGSRRQGGQIRRYKDTLKSSLKRLQINPTNWEELALDRPTWRRTVKTGAALYEANRIAAAKVKREARKSQLRPVRNADAQPLPTRPRCQRTFRAGAYTLQFYVLCHADGRLPRRTPWNPHRLLPPSTPVGSVHLDSVPMRPRLHGLFESETIPTRQASWIGRLLNDARTWLTQFVALCVVADWWADDGLKQHLPRPSYASERHAVQPPLCEILLFVSVWGPGRAVARAGMVSLPCQPPRPFLTLVY
nr:unnamed protein product [Spirometra erinaceieuropaei]